MGESAFLIAATSSGCGKTTLSLGLMRELTRRGLSVQPFKCGPDYIDTQFHGKATGNPSINLDTFMSSKSHVKNLFSHYSYGKNVAIVEGVMGMYDGYSKMSGSSADLSQMLSIPVILLVNAASTAYSVAATIYGFKNFHTGINITGVIFNRVSSESHFSFLKEACMDAGVECIGYIKKDNTLVTPSRHLGLTLTTEEKMESFINSAADAVKSNVDIDRLLQLTEIQISHNHYTPKEVQPDKIAAIACDEAFNFIYPANLDRLREQGYRIVKFSPLHDKVLPEADFVYLPGGYPELYIEQLAGNAEMKNCIRKYVENDGKLWGECGGMIYLSKEMDSNPLCGVFPIRCTMKNSKLSLGYRNIDFGNMVFRGHEFHYSSVTNPDCLKSIAIQSNARGRKVNTPVYKYKNAFASYTHLYWGDNNIFKLWQQ